MPGAFDLFPACGTFGAQCSAILPGFGVTPNVAANSPLYLQVDEACDRFSTILAGSWLQLVLSPLDIPTVIKKKHQVAVRRGPSSETVILESAADRIRRNIYTGGPICLGHSTLSGGGGHLKNILAQSVTFPIY